MPAASMRKRLLWQGRTLPFACINSGGFLWWTQAPLHTLPVVAQTTLQTPQAVSLQPAPVLPAEVSLKPEFQPPATVCQQTCASGWGVLCLVPLCPARRSPRILWSPLLSGLISPLTKGLPRVKEPFLFHSSLLGATVPSQYFLSFFSLPGYMELFPIALNAFKTFCPSSADTL